MKAQDFLKQLKKIDCIISNKMAELEQWQNVATSITAPMGGERVQSSGSKERMADAVCEKVDILTEIREEINRLLAKRKEIISVLEQLEADEYDLMYKVYVGKLELRKDGTMVTRYMQLKEVADLYCNSYGWATNIHGTALKNVQKIIDAEKTGD
jgi:hypothetical protein